jgi:hypothetical protein
VSSAPIASVSPVAVPVAQPVPVDFPVSSLCASLSKFVAVNSKKRAASLKRNSKPSQPQAASPIAVRTRGSIKRTASLGDLSQASVASNVVVISPPRVQGDKTLAAISVHLKKRKEARESEVNS